ncbi:amino acid transporter [Babesia caballi]|uniref:Amino acid transporter n=1 Tax=Babesia caballi TaxID=5871 RepID=A0AAV4LM79_BABCB|nr:amino acid transporter [Babesia caballi]
MRFLLALVNGQLFHALTVVVVVQLVEIEARIVVVGGRGAFDLVHDFLLVPFSQTFCHFPRSNSRRSGVITSGLHLLWTADYVGPAGAPPLPDAYLVADGEHVVLFGLDAPVVDRGPVRRPQVEQQQPAVPVELQHEPRGAQRGEPAAVAHPWGDIGLARGQLPDFGLELLYLLLQALVVELEFFEVLYHALRVLLQPVALAAEGVHLAFQGVPLRSQLRDLVRQLRVAVDELRVERLVVAVLRLPRLRRVGVARRQLLLEHLDCVLDFRLQVALLLLAAAHLAAQPRRLVQRYRQVVVGLLQGEYHVEVPPSVGRVLQLPVAQHLQRVRLQRVEDQQPAVKGAEHERDHVALLLAECAQCDLMLVVDAQKEPERVVLAEPDARVRARVPPLYDALCREVVGLQLHLLRHDVHDVLDMTAVRLRRLLWRMQAPAQAPCSAGIALQKQIVARSGADQRVLYGPSRGHVDVDRPYLPDGSAEVPVRRAIEHEARANVICRESVSGPGDVVDVYFVGGVPPRPPKDAVLLLHSRDRRDDHPNLLRVEL